jgi:hypothetical protein
MVVVELVPPFGPDEALAALFVTTLSVLTAFPASDARTFGLEVDLLALLPPRRFSFTESSTGSDLGCFEPAVEGCLDGRLVAVDSG